MSSTTGPTTPKFTTTAESSSVPSTASSTVPQTTTTAAPSTVPSTASSTALQTTTTAAPSTTITDRTSSSTSTSTYTTIVSKENTTSTSSATTDVTFTSCATSPDRNNSEISAQYSMEQELNKTNAALKTSEELRSQQQYLMFASWGLAALLCITTIGFAIGFFKLRQNAKTDAKRKSHQFDLQYFM